MKNSKPTNRYESLDGLRAISIFGILLMHYIDNIDKKICTNLMGDSFLYSDIIPFCTQFVYVFFIVSALSMCCGYFEKFRWVDGACQFNLNTFYNKRYMRIWPFFALLVLIDLAMKPSLSELYEGFADLTLAFNLLPNPDIHVIGVAWFIGVIFLFYMLFPWFVYLLQSKLRAWVAMVVALIMNVILMQYFMTPEFCTESQMAMPRINFLYSFPFILAGGMLYLYRKELTGILPKWISLGLTIVGILIQFIWEPAPLGDNHLYLLLLFCCLIVFFMNYEGKLFNNKVLHFFGGYSMEVYLCHMMIFRILEKVHLDHFITNDHIFYWLTCILGFTCSVAFAWCFKQVSEKISAIRNK